jgi:hypothetical protein
VSRGYSKILRHSEYQSTTTKGNMKQTYITKQQLHTFIDTKDRKFQVDGTTGKRLYKKGGKRTTTPEHNMLVTDLDVQEGYKYRNVPMNQRLRYLLIGKKAIKFNYLADSDSFKVEFPKATRNLLKNLYRKNFEDFEQENINE